MYNPQKYLLVLFSLAILFSACKTRKVPEEKKVEHPPKGSSTVREISKKEHAKDFEIETRCKPAAEKISKSIPWGDAPDFTLFSVDGKSLTLSEFAGKVIILDFWATWCPPCLKEIPDFIELYNEYKNKGLVVVGISLDKNISDLKKYMKKVGLNYPIVLGDQKVVKDFGGIRGIPTTFIIDRKGNIKEKLVGFRPKNVFEKEIKKLF